MQNFKGLCIKGAWSSLDEEEITRNLWYVSEGGLIQYGQGEGVNFLRFCAGAFYGRPLRLM